MTDQRHCILWAGVVALTLLLPPVTRDGNDYLGNNVHNFADRRTQSLSKQGADLSKLDAFRLKACCDLLLLSQSKRKGKQEHPRPSI